MKLTLIMPKWQTGLRGIRIFKMPPMGLALLASLTPNDLEVKIVDENIEDLKIEQTDVVGISVTTSVANRAYKIADEYRKLGIKVILGGTHPSVLPKEASKHADSIVVGEADYIWPTVINDFKQNKLKKVYKVDNRPDISNLPFPRRDLLKKNKYFFPTLIQTSRGCPFGCDFCSVSKFSGRMVRHRPIEHVIKEIESTKSFFKKYIFFTDDNIAANPNYTEKLLQELIPLNVKWGSQASLPIAKNERLLKLAAESGCKALFIGFESLNQSCLNEVHKSYRTEEYQTLIRKIHDYGMALEGSFIFGFDNDNKNAFEDTIDFCYKNDLEAAQFTPLTPFPGTELFNRLNREGRILTYNWDLYDALHVVFQPKTMSPQELQDGVINTYQKFYSTRSIFKRIILRSLKLRPYYAALTALINFDFKHIKI